MCCCGKPTINGEKNAYSHDGKHFSTYPLLPPTILPNYRLLYDEPGRCEMIDGHHNHFMLVHRENRFVLLVRHSKGEEHHELPSFLYFTKGRTLDLLGTNGRYWLFNSIYRTIKNAQAATQFEFLYSHHS